MYNLIFAWLKLILKEKLGEWGLGREDWNIEKRERKRRRQRQDCSK